MVRYETSRFNKLFVVSPVVELPRPMPPHLFLVSIEADLSNSLEKTLLAQGYRVSQSAEISELSEVRQVRPDLLIMALPENKDADLAPCRRLSASLDAVPIMLLGRDNHDDRVASLNICANDYLPVPFVMAEFLARVRAKLRRGQWDQSDDFFVVAGLRLDAQSREVHYGNRAIDLTSKEFDLLKYLIAHPRQVMTQQQIVDEVWPDSVLTDDSNVVQVYVRSLRRKLGDAKDMIQTVRGVGYGLKESSSASVA